MTRPKPTRLPELWTPDLLDPIAREEYDHLAAFGWPAERILPRIGITIESACRHAYARG